MLWTRQTNVLRIYGNYNSHRKIPPNYLPEEGAEFNVLIVAAGTPRQQVGDGLAGPMLAENLTNILMQKDPEPAWQLSMQNLLVAEFKVKVVGAGGTVQQVGKLRNYISTGVRKQQQDDVAELQQCCTPGQIIRWERLFFAPSSTISNKSIVK